MVRTSFLTSLAAGEQEERLTEQRHGATGYAVTGRQGRSGRTPPQGGRTQRQRGEREAATTATVAPDLARSAAADEVLHRVDGVRQRQHVADRLEHRRQRSRGARTARTAGSAGARTAGMNCTAWNSVCAKALTNRPSAVPSTASTTATTPSSQTGPSTSRPSSPTLTADRERRLDRGEQRRTRGRSRAGSRACPSASSSSRSRVPRERSRSVVTLVTRNITMNGNIASSAGPEAVEDVAGQVLEHPPQQADQQRTAAPAASPACGGRGGAG